MNSQLCSCGCGAAEDAHCWNNSDFEVNTETEITWFVWKWNKGAVHKNDFMFDCIVVSKSWIKQNNKAQGQVVKGPFINICDCINECEIQNNQIKENICDHVDCNGETERTNESMCSNHKEESVVELLQNTIYKNV